VPFRAPGRRQRARSRIRGAGSRSRAQRKVGPMARMASGILRRFGGRKLAVDVRLVVCLCGRLSAEVFRLATIGARMDEASPNAFGRSPGVTAEQASNVHQAPYRSLQLSHCSWRHGRSARPLIGRSERGQRHVSALGQGSPACLRHHGASRVGVVHSSAMLSNSWTTAGTAEGEACASCART
jgi:hypothetical protein